MGTVEIYPHLILTITLTLFQSEKGGILCPPHTTSTVLFADNLLLPALFLVGNSSANIPFFSKLAKARLIAWHRKTAIHNLNRRLEPNV